MAKGGKGRKGGGGGGGKTRKYSRDSNGRFASTGTGATARGGRLLTAKGNKRTARALAGKTKTIEATGQKGVLAKPKGVKPGSIKPKAAKPSAVAAAPKAAKLPREQRLARAKVTAKRIDQKLKAKADETGAAFAERRRISSRASSKARTAAFEKEAVAGKASATALRASQRSNARVTRLNEEKGKYAQAARDAATKSTVKPAPKLATKPPEPAVKIAKRKPLTSAQIAAGREADRREMASVRKKPASWLAPTPVAKPAALSTKAKTPKFTTEQSGRVRRAALGGGRTAIVRKNSAVIINAKGEPIMTRKGLPNITAGKKYAANPNARGPRLMGRDRSEASPSRGYIRTSKPTGTINKPKGLKPGAVKAAGKPTKAAAIKPTNAIKRTGKRLGDDDVQSDARAFRAEKTKLNTLEKSTKAKLAKAEAQLAKLNTGPAKPKSLQSKDAQSDRLDVAGRKKKAKALLEMSKPARKAVRVSLLAQRAGFGGAGVSTDGRKKGSSSSAIANIDSGRMRLISDSGKRKGKLTAGQRQANERTMITSGKSLQARLRTKQIGAKVKGMGGDRKTMAAAAKPKGVITKAKPKPSAASAAAKPAAPKAARRKSVGSISEAKAGRIISRIDANRPGLRRASGSARKTANAIRTQQRATDFALAASARGRKQGKNLSVNQSLQRAIKNASAKRKPRGMR